MSTLGQKTKADYLAMDEYRRLISELESEKRYMWALYMVFSASSALRVGDVLSTKWRDIIDGNQSNARMKVRFTKLEQKTGKQRSINFSQSISDKILGLYVSLGRPDLDSYLFQSTYADGAVSVQYINKELKRIKEKYDVQIGNFSSHTLRKTFARATWESAGRSAESLIMLMDVLGHSSLSVTKIYLGITEDEIAGVYNRFEL